MKPYTLVLLLALSFVLSTASRSRTSGSSRTSSGSSRKNSGSSKTRFGSTKPKTPTFGSNKKTGISSHDFGSKGTKLTSKINKPIGSSNIAQTNNNKGSSFGDNFGSVSIPKKPKTKVPKTPFGKTGVRISSTKFGLGPKRCSTSFDCRGTAGYLGKCFGRFCSCSVSYQRTQYGCLPSDIGHHSINNPLKNGKMCFSDFECKSFSHDDGLADVCLNNRCACRRMFVPVSSGSGCQRYGDSVNDLDKTVGTSGTKNIGVLGVSPNRNVNLPDGTSSGSNKNIGDYRHKGRFCNVRGDCPFNGGYSGSCNVNLKECDCDVGYIKENSGCFKSGTTSLSVTAMGTSLIMVIATFVVNMLGLV